MMGANYAILCDVTCDLSRELRERFGIDGYMSGHLTLPGGVEVDSKLEWDSISQSPRDFYTSLKSHHHDYKTAPASTEEIAAFWDGYLSEGRDILAISLSSKLSVTYNLMVNAQKALQTKYPERKILVVDSKKYSVASGLLAIMACQLRGQGMSIEENAAALDRQKASIHQMGSIDDLFYVASQGRVSHAKAFMGTLVGIKPLGDFDSDGMITVLAKVKGFEKVYAVVIEYIKKTIVQPENQLIIVAQTLREKQAVILADLIKERVKPKELILSDIYPASGVNTGPGVLGAYYFGTPISDLAYEKDVMKSILEKL